LWHGASWVFIAWGVLHGVLVAINHLWSSTPVSIALRKSRNPWVRRIYDFAAWALTMLSVIALWVIFRADSWRTVIDFGRAIREFRFLGGHPIPDMHIYYALPAAVCVLFLACWTLPNSIEMARAVRRTLRRHDRLRAPLPLHARLGWTVPAIVTGICLYVAVTSISFVKSEFLYFNF
jgi:hypothetical protein